MESLLSEGLLDAMDRILALSDGEVVALHGLKQGGGSINGKAATVESFSKATGR